MQSECTHKKESPCKNIYIARPTEILKTSLSAKSIKSKRKGVGCYKNIWRMITNSSIRQQTLAKKN